MTRIERHRIVGNVLMWIEIACIIGFVFNIHI